MNIQRLYLDVRLGWSAVSPIIAFANFVMIVFLAFNKALPIEIYLPIFSISLLIGLTYAGNVFRKRQLKIDSNLSYEQQSEPAKTTRILFDDIHRLQSLFNIPISQESLNRRQYMYDIEVGKYG